MKKEKILPIGTVVLLKNSTKKVMIIGFGAIEKSKREIFDYAGCLYPEGIFDPSKVLLFNHDFIADIYYLGYINDDWIVIRPKLEEAIIGERKNEKVDKGE